MITTNLDIGGNLRGSVQAQGGASIFALPTPTGLAVGVGSGNSNLPQILYYYQVSAFNDFGETLASAEVSYFPPSPIAINANSVTWSPVIGATGYKLYGRSIGASKTLLATLSGVLNSSFNDIDINLLPATLPNGALPTANTTGHLIVAAGYAKLFLLSAPAAANLTGVHAALAATAANLFPGPITNPPIIRNLVVDFSAGWDGGNVTIVGTDQFSDAPVTEVFAAVPATTVVGLKIFRTVFSITKGIIGTAGTASVGVGGKLGIQGKLLNTADALLFANNVIEAATLDATFNGYVPTTAPNGAVNFMLLANVKE